MNRSLLVAVLLPAVAWAGPRADALAEQAEAKLVAEEMLGARTLAEEALALDPSQYRAHYVLGMVHRESEGNLAQAMFHLGESRRAYETRYAASLDTDWRFHQRLLYSVQLVAGDIEEFTYQLSIIDYYDARFDPDLVAERAWPLMKLGRLGLARSVATTALQSTDDWQRSMGANALCALESHAGQREAAYRACLGALEAERGSPSADVTVDAYNASLAAFQSLRYLDGELLAMEANTGSSGSTANPWSVLAMAYIAQGRGTDAVYAVRNMQAWRARVDPELRDMNRAEADAVYALVLLPAGEPELGYDMVSRAIDFPDRRAMTSGTADQARGGHAMLRIALRRAKEERQRERTSTLGLLPRAWASVGRWVPDPTEWQDRAAVTAALSDDRRMKQTMGMYLDGGLDVVPPWLLGEVIRVLGTGVASTALEGARRDEELPGMSAFYDALEAEIQWRRGAYASVDETARAALAGLPAEESLLRARVSAVAADAARRQGNGARALSLYTDAMRADPSVLRSLGLELPAVLSAAGGPASGFAESMLARSPRLRSGGAGFGVVVNEAGRSLEICLSEPSGARLLCAQEPAQPAPPDGQPLTPWTDWERAQQTVEAFHAVAFALPTGLSSRDWRGLDGTGAEERESSRQEMESLLDQLTQPRSTGP